jgi:hypothetical protein
MLIKHLLIVVFGDIDLVCRNNSDVTEDID